MRQWPSVTGFAAGRHALCRPFSKKSVQGKKPSFEWTILPNQLPKTQISSREAALSAIKKAIDAAMKQREHKS
jgi:hypothetical protein